MIAWDILLSNSTVTAPSIAWVHLNNQGCGSGILQVFGQMEVVLMPELDAQLDSDLVVVLESELITELEPELVTEVC